MGTFERGEAEEASVSTFSRHDVFRAVLEPLIYDRPYDRLYDRL